MQQTASFGQWLKTRRQELDLTQERLAEEAGCSVDTVRKIEAGRRRPSRQIADIFASRLNVAPEVRTAFIEWARGGPGIEEASPGSAQPEPRSRTTLSVQPHPTSYLPASLTPLVGREREIAQARNLLWRTTTRLLTFTGPPGIGKTRLALAVASTLESDFADGLLFVPLAPIANPDLVVPTLSQALGLEERPQRPALLSLQEYLRDKQLLLVLDNFEQVVEAAPIVSALLTAAPQLNVLVTSRIPLHLRGEKILSVPPLEVPGGHEELGTVSSVRLFVERAQDAQPDFALNAGNAQVIAAICARLEGLPLAIELAAAKLRLLTPGELLARLERRLVVLTDGPRDAPRHQQTLRAAIASSYDLLGEKEQKIFRKLGVFAGAFGIAEAMAVAGAAVEDLMILADHSLLRPQHKVDADGAEGGGERGVRFGIFGMLETIREFALEQLEERGEAGSMSQSHAEYYLALAEAAEAEWLGPRRREWIERLELARYDLRAALRWARVSGEVTMTLRMSAALWQFWFQRGYTSEGREELEATLSSSEGLASADRARVLYAAGEFAALRNDQASRRGFYMQSLETARESGNDGASKKALTDALRGLANLAIDEADNALARQYLENRLAIFTELDDERGIAASLYSLGTLAFHEANYELARCQLEESLEMSRKIGTPGGAIYLNLGEVTRAQGDYATARTFYEESLAIFQEHGSKPGTATSLGSLGHLARQEGNYDAALDYWAASLDLRRQLGNKDGVAKCLAGISEIWGAQGYAERAAQLSGAVDTITDALGGLRFDPIDQSAYDRSRTMLRDALGDETFEAARREGAAMPLEDAIAFALTFSKDLSPTYGATHPG
jgi:predicted ATPase/transcriptional regulator with XRE-family HTH domain